MPLTNQTKGWLWLENTGTIAFNVKVGWRVTGVGQAEGVVQLITQVTGRKPQMMRAFAW